MNGCTMFYIYLTTDCENVRLVWNKNAAIFFLMKWKKKRNEEKEIFEAQL